MVGDRAYLAQCLAKMHMAPALVDQIPAVLRGKASFTPAARPADEGAPAAIDAAARGLRTVYDRALSAPSATEPGGRRRHA
jgi:hypothetical protein